MVGGVTPADRRRPADVDARARPPGRALRPRRAERPRDVRGGNDRAGPRGGARAARPDPRATSRSRSSARRSAAGSPRGRSASSRWASGGSRRCSRAVASRRPAGTLDLPPNPASAAGPDLRQLVLGSEGRLGIITRATVRTRPQAPTARPSPPGSCPTGRTALDAARDARAGRAAAVDAPRLDAARDPVAARDGGPVRATGDILASVPPAARRWGRSGRSSSSARAASERFVEGAVREARLDPAAARRRRGRRLDRAALDRDPLPLGVPAQHALGRRLRGRHARDRGRLDPACRTSPPPSAGRSATGSTTRASASTRSATSRTSTRRLEPVRDVRLPAIGRPGRDAGAVARAQARPRARRSWPAAARSATSTASGADHAPYLAAEKGELGMAALADVARRFDPDGIMNPGVLVGAGRVTGRDRRAHPRDRRRDAERPGARCSTRAARSLAPGAGPDRAVRLAPARLGRAGPGASTGARSARRAGRCGRGPAPSRRDAIAARRAHDPARHGRRHGRGRRAAPARDRLARPAPDARACRRSAACAGLAFRALGVRDTVAAFQADGEANWIRAQRAGGLGGGSATTCFLSGFLVHRLTGRFVDSVASQVGYVPFDYKRFRWAEPATGSGRRRPVDPRLAAGARPADRAARRADRRGRGRTSGCRPGMPLIAAAADKACEVARLGRGRRRDVAAISFGTTATINTTHRRYVEAIPLVPPYPAAMPGAWLARGPGLPRLLDGRVVQARVRRSARWPGPRPTASRPRRCSTSSSRQTPPGSMGLMLQPYWSPGVRDPGPARRRARSSASATSTPGPTSTARSSRASPTRCARAPSARQARAKVPIRELRVSGGGVAVAGDRPADRRRLRAADRPAAHPRDVRPGRGDRRRGRDRPPSGHRRRPPRAMARVAETRDPDPASATRSTRSCTSAST